MIEVQNAFDDRENFFCDRSLEVVSHVWILNQLEKYLVAFWIAVEPEDRITWISVRTLRNEVLQLAEFDLDFIFLCVYVK